MKFCMKPRVTVETLTLKNSNQNELHTQRKSKCIVNTFKDKPRGDQMTFQYLNTCNHK